MCPCAALLTCPVCAGRLADAGASFVCPRRHTFDRAREGHVDLLPAGHGRSKIRGDTADMLRARRRFLARGHYEPLAAAVAGAVLRHLGNGLDPHELVPRPRGPAPARSAPAAKAAPGESGSAASGTGPVVLDAGCGEGYYLGSVMERVTAHARGGCFFGLDVSRDAVRMAARAHRAGIFFRNDVRHRISLEDGCVDALLNVFAPRNRAEFGRVLAPDGLLVVVIPQDAHLAELREAVPLLGIGEDKPERTVEQLAGTFEPAGRETVEYRRELDPDDVADLLRMTPNYWHLDPAAIERAGTQAPARVTLSFSVLRFRRADTPPGSARPRLRG